MAKTLSKSGTVKRSLHGKGQVAPSLPAGQAGAVEKRLPVMKTYKIFIGGKFPRTESGRYYQPQGSDGKPLANICRSSGTVTGLARDSA